MKSMIRDLMLSRRGATYDFIYRERKESGHRNMSSSG